MHNPGPVLYSKDTRTWPAHPGQPGRAPWRSSVKKFLTLFGLLSAIGAVVFYFRRNQDDDEFLDEELQ